MNKNVNKFFLAAGKFTHELHLCAAGFTYSAFGPFTKYLESIKQFKKTNDLHYVYRNELKKPCFSHDAACTFSKDPAKRTISDKILKDRTFKTKIVINPKYDRYQRGLASMVYRFFNNKKKKQD